MNRRRTRVFCLFITILFFAGCSTVEFVAEGKTPFKISMGKNSEKEVEVNSSADFYFWGKSPGHATIDLEDFSNTFGLELPSAVAVSQTTSFKSIVYSIVTLGLYCPVDIRVSLLTKKGPIQ